MNKYERIALVMIRVEVVLTLLYALREFFAVVLYVAAEYLGLFPRFYLNVGYTVYWGFLNMFMGLFIWAISKPVATFIGSRFEDKE
jgi:hypothetical protein